MAWLGDLGSALLSVLYANPVAVAVLGLLGLVLLAIVARRRSWDAAARRHPRRTAALLAILVVTTMPIGWYLASPLVLSASIDEPAPSVVARPASPSSAATADFHRSRFHLLRRDSRRDPIRRGFSPPTTRCGTH